MEGPDRVGHTVDVALGSRSLGEATARSQGVRRGEAGVSDWDLRGVPRGLASVGTGRPEPWYSYPRSSKDSKMSVSMRSHSMLVVFKFPSRLGPLSAGNAYTSACAASPELPNRRLAPQPPHCACPERAQQTWSRLPLHPC